MLIYLKSSLLILVSTYLLAACSSSPSPWSESASPWGSKSDQQEVVAEDPAVDAEQYTFVEPIPEPVMIAEPVVPKPVVMEPVEMEPVMSVVEPAPVSRKRVVANDLQNQPADFFAVQVCASRSMKQLNNFAKHYNLSTQWTTQTNVGGETWYVLLEGVYATRSEAAQALSLMKSQVDTGPWIRTMGSLQAVMQ